MGVSSRHDGEEKSGGGDGGRHRRRGGVVCSVIILMSVPGTLVSKERRRNIRDADRHRVFTRKTLVWGSCWVTSIHGKVEGRRMGGRLTLRACPRCPDQGKGRACSSSAPLGHWRSPKGKKRHHRCIEKRKNGIGSNWHRRADTPLLFHSTVPKSSFPILLSNVEITDNNNPPPSLQEQRLCVRVCECELSGRRMITASYCTSVSPSDMHARSTRLMKVSWFGFSPFFLRDANGVKAIIAAVGTCNACICNARVGYRSFLLGKKRNRDFV